MSRKRFASLVVAGLLVASTGCTIHIKDDRRGDDGNKEVQVAGQATPAAAEQVRQVATPTPTPTAPTYAIEDIAAAVLTATEVGHGVEEKDREQGLDTVTNDICAKQWPSNDDRTAREQAFYWKGEDGEHVMSNEVVAYLEGTGAAALDEIRSAVSECTGWKHRNGEMTGITAAAVPDGALPGSFAWAGTDRRAAGETTYSYLAVYQLTGDLLSGLYLWAPDEAELRELADELTPKVADRLRDATGTP